MFGFVRRTAVLTRAVRSLATEPDKISKLLKDSRVVVFMKGTPEAPRCGFSNAVVQILRMHSVPYNSHDVLADEDLRQGM